MTPSFIGLMATMLPGRPPEHVLRILAHGFDAAGHLVDGHDRRLVDDNPLPRA
jgi:hypothetical protein